MFFDRDKVQMSLETEKDVYLPGDTIHGVMRVRVLKEVTVTALRLHFCGKESAEVKVRKHNKKNKKINHNNNNNNNLNNNENNNSKKRRQKGSDEVLHYEKLFTFFGYAARSGRRGGATLAATITDDDDNHNKNNKNNNKNNNNNNNNNNDLSYAFSLPLPATTAPTFSLTCGGNSEARLTYKLTGLCVIDKGFDGKVERYVKVLSVVPLQQFERLIGVSHAMEPQTISISSSSSSNSSGCCFCCRRKDKNPTVTVTMACPQLVMFNDNGAAMPSQEMHLGQSHAGVDENNNNNNNNINNINNNNNNDNNNDYYHYQQPRPMSDPTGVENAPPTAPLPMQPMPTVHKGTNYLPVSLEVVNNSSTKKIKTITVTLKQFLQISCKGVSAVEVRPVAVLTHRPPNGGIPPRQRYTAVLRLDLGVSLGVFGHKNEKKSYDNGGIVQPTMATRFVEVSNLLEVEFPNLKVKETMSLPDACWFVSAVDGSNASPPIPVRYNTSTLLPEEVLGGAMI